MSVQGEIAWFSPDPRCVIDLDHFHASHRLMRRYRQGDFDIKVDSAFNQVIAACAEREGEAKQEPNEEITWISPEIIDVYSQMHRLGLAHSVESYHQGRLVGGLYGVALGGAFMGESMFHTETDASKVCLVFLVERLKQRGFALLDCQYQTAHLSRFGAILIPRTEYLSQLELALKLDCQFV